MIVLYVLLIAIAVLIGITFFQLFKKRYLFYKELVEFLDLYKQNLLYYQNPISAIIDSSASNFRELKDVLLEYKLKKNDELISLSLPHYIGDGQKVVINKLFNSLGVGDLETEMDKTEKARYEFLNEKNKHKETYDKYGVLSIKVSFLLGMLLVILLV